MTEPVSTFLLTQGVLGVMVILETGLIVYLLREVKRLQEVIIETKARTQELYEMFAGETYEVIDEKPKRH